MNKTPNRLNQSKPKAVVLLSGGLDSATCLAIAKDKGYEVYALSFDYGQRSQTELQAAQKLARDAGVIHKVIQINLGNIGGSALVDETIDMPEEGVGDDIPVTYVPARNTVFLSFALGWAEVLEAETIFIGVNAVDYSGYPDCRPEFIDAYQQLIPFATKAGVNGQHVTIQTPLISLTKAEIIQTGKNLGVDYALTISCYQADDNGLACGKCDSCRLRQQGFANAGLADPTPYQ